MLTLDEAKLGFVRRYIQYLSHEGEEKKEALRDMDYWGGICYSMPHLRPFMPAWMVDINFGDCTPRPFRSGESSAHLEPDDNCEEINELLSLIVTNPEEFSAYIGGEFFRKLEKELGEFGFVVCERGGSSTGGHMGGYCTDDLLNKVMNFLWAKYSRLIWSGIIFPKIAWFKPHFDGIPMSIDELREYVNSRENS